MGKALGIVIISENSSFLQNDVYIVYSKLTITILKESNAINISLFPLQIKLKPDYLNIVSFMILNLNLSIHQPCFNSLLF